MKKEEDIIKVNENSIIYKIKNFIYNIFHKKEYVQVNERPEEIKKQDELGNDITIVAKQSFQDTVKIEQNQEVELLAHKIQEGKIDPKALSEDELDKVIECFEESIKQKQAKLEKIKNRIITLKQQMK